MQRDIGESTSRTQTPTPLEPAAVGTRPPQLPPVFHHPHHHSPTTIPSPSTKLKGGGPDAGGETQCPLTPFLTYLPSTHPPVRADRNSKGENKKKKGKEEQTELEKKATTFHTSCVSWPTTEILRFGKYEEEEEVDWEWEEENKKKIKIKNVEDIGKPVVVL